MKWPTSCSVLRVFRLGESQKANLTIMSTPNLDGVKQDGFSQPFSHQKWWKNTYFAQRLVNDSIIISLHRILDQQKYLDKLACQFNVVKKCNFVIVH